MMLVEGKIAIRRIGYCAANCDGHSTQVEAVEHFLQYQLDRIVLWFSRRGERECEMPMNIQPCGHASGEKLSCSFYVRNIETSIQDQSARLTRSSMAGRSVNGA